MQFLVVCMLLLLAPRLARAEEYVLTITVTHDEALLLQEAVNGDDRKVATRLQAGAQMVADDLLTSRQRGKVAEVQNAFEKGDATRQQAILDAIKQGGEKPTATEGEVVK